MSKGDNYRPVDKAKYDENFEAVFGKKELKLWEDAPKTEDGGEPFWQEYPRSDGRMEWACPHGVGHGRSIHGCDGCCKRKDFPGHTEPHRWDSRDIPPV